MAIDIRGMAPLLQVYDMPTSIKFYCEVLGFEIVTTDGKPVPNCDWVLLRRNGVELMLNTAYEAHQRPPKPDPVRISSHQDTGLFFGCPDVDAAQPFPQHRRRSKRAESSAVRDECYICPIPTDTSFASNGERIGKSSELLRNPTPPVSAVNFVGREVQSLIRFFHPDIGVLGAMVDRDLHNDAASGGIRAVH
jgi:catechol 2,3-dioxygenase-like lactoylglutathione lyase family enzyme